METLRVVELREVVGINLEAFQLPLNQIIFQLDIGAETGV